MNFDLRKLRMLLPGKDGKHLSQLEFAELVLKSIEFKKKYTVRGLQSTISKWENDPNSLSLETFFKICEAVGVDPGQVLIEMSKDKTSILRLKDPFVDLNVRMNLLKSYIEPALQRNLSSNDNMIFHKSLLKELNHVVERLHLKPTLAFAGAFDAGKSAMVKALTGTEAIETNWTPTTAISTFLVHVDDRPDFMREDVWIFKQGTNPNKGWDFTRYRDEEYCEKWILEKGHYEIFMRHGTHQGRKKYQMTEAGSALIFLSAPILKACNIIDMPGYGGGTPSLDEIQKQQVSNIADAVVFLSTANQFMSETDNVFLNEILRRLPVVELDSGVIPFGNIMVVASQIHILKSSSLVKEKDFKNEIKKILLRSEDVFGSITGRVKARHLKNNHDDSGKEIFSNIFTPYTLDDKKIRRTFELKLKSMLTNVIAPYFSQEMEKVVINFKRRAIEVADNEIKKYETIMSERETTEKRFKNAKVNKPKDIAKLDTKLSSLIELIDLHETESSKDFDNRWNNLIKVEVIEDKITDNFSDRKSAAKYVGGMVIEESKDFVEEIIQTRMEDCKPAINELFKDYEIYAKKLSGADPGTSDIPFDFQGALAGAITSAGVLGGLGLWASSLGNLGWYIIAAKGVSVLSALGFSVGGGVAGAMSFLAGIGGPIVAAAGLAVVVGLAVFSFFGESWQKRLAKKVVDLIQRSDIKSNLKGQLSKFWSDTAEGLEEVTELLKEKIDEYISDLGLLLKSSNPKDIEQRIKICKEHRRFFANILWNPL